ncbi:hypothetical protein, partial [Stutzerimonas stutzeri]|uniref:hypothetical protein n=1 Tax=Stutzerimonas stutzeri TaxID=316 RepID=UPI001C614364
VVQVFQNHAHSTLTDFRGVGSSLSHGLIFSRVEASTKPGVIQYSDAIELLVSPAASVLLCTSIVFSLPAAHLHE